MLFIFKQKFNKKKNHIEHSAKLLVSVFYNNFLYIIHKIKFISNIPRSSYLLNYTKKLLYMIHIQHSSKRLVNFFYNQLLKIIHIELSAKRY